MPQLMQQNDRNKYEYRVKRERQAKGQIGNQHGADKYHSLADDAFSATLVNRTQP